MDATCKSRVKLTGSFLLLCSAAPLNGLPIAVALLCLAFLVLNFQNDDEAAASMLMVTDTNLVIAQEGEKCSTDGFIRTLVVSFLLFLQEAAYLYFKVCFILFYFYRFT